ncbi:unnamed protein product [Sphenostylis stenocarpa]|uniref:Uncharacterized protein n=1 Tax=Sphenostylis stenocarpa TaxID=92480 RepID=A0AA86VVX1_9FABA|nr:unnamed protein product [Sphenostylis stenocarpa]
MAFLLNKTTIASHFRSHSQKTEDSASFPRRRYHVEPGPREKALLAEDSALKPFKSYKKNVKQLKKIGDVLTVVVVAVGNDLSQIYILAEANPWDLEIQSFPQMLSIYRTEQYGYLHSCLKDAVTNYMLELLHERKHRDMCETVRIRSTKFEGEQLFEGLVVMIYEMFNAIL